MREYDDHIRLYTPVLQRIIVLVAVIVAVPVVLWTITAFVRTYVGPPRVPTFQRMSTAMVTPADTAAALSDANTAPAPSASAQAATGAPPPAETRPPAGDTRVQLLSFKKPPEPDQSQVPVPAAAPNTPAPTASTAPQIAVAATTSTQPVIAPAVPTMAGPQTDKSDRVAAPAPPAPAIAWPTPPPLPAPAADAATGPVSDDAAQADALPAAPPITGPIPLPRRRPTLFAMVQPVGGGVPMPKPRPQAAGPAAGDTPPGPLDWLGKLFQPQPQNSPQNP
jgi:hypothetical protein